MNYISAHSGQSLQLYQPDEVRPLERGPFLPDVIARTVARYQFAKLPTLPAAEEGPLKFEIGKIIVDGVEISINSLEIYRDGIIVNTRHTDDSDAVIDDFFGWMIETFGFRAPMTKILRRYVSAVIVDLDSPLNSFLSRFERAQQIVSDAYEQTRGERRDFHVSQITITPNLAEPQRDFFRLEIRTSSPHVVPNRYFCTAPLPTRAHIEMLAALERAV
jgi:hypothetical protein